MKAQVVCVTNRRPTEPYYIFDKFISSLRRFSCKPVILGWEEPWYGLMTKPRLFRRWLRDKQNDSDIIIFCDAWDIVFAVNPINVFTAYKTYFDGKVVFNAEQNCFPRGDWASKFPDPGTPYRYPNCGFMIGSPQAFLTIVEGMNLDFITNDYQRPDGSWANPNDQEYYTQAFLNQPVPMVLDTNCEICQCCSGTSVEDFDFDGEQIKNRITNTTPGVFHFNGGSKNDVMPKVLGKLGL